MSIDADTFAETVRSGGSLAGADLREADPFIMDLSGLDLRDADLSGSHLPMTRGEGAGLGSRTPLAAFSGPYRANRWLARCQ